MLSPDLEYLRRIKIHSSPTDFLHEAKFLKAQALFFAVVESLGGSVDFEIADMREVHAIAALGDVKGLRVLDIGCGSTEPYVLDDTFRDRYPPFFAEMLAKLGADVSGVDIRPNPSANYGHRVLDVTQEKWIDLLHPPYDIIACLSIFNAPESPFEKSTTLCDHIMSDIHTLLAPHGLAIVTLRDDVFEGTSKEEQRKGAISNYVATHKFRVIESVGNTAWLALL